VSQRAKEVMEDGGWDMLEENSLIIIALVVEILTAIVFLVSVIFIALTFSSNRKFHKQRLFNEVASNERTLKIKLNEYYQKNNGAPQFPKAIFVIFAEIIKNCFCSPKGCGLFKQKALFIK